jgi:hypothetical protein
MAGTISKELSQPAWQHRDDHHSGSNDKSVVNKDDATESFKQTSQILRMLSARMTTFDAQEISRTNPTALNSCSQQIRKRKAQKGTIGSGLSL